MTGGNYLRLERTRDEGRRAASSSTWPQKRHMRNMKYSCLNYGIIYVSQPIRDDALAADIKMASRERLRRQ